MEDATQQNVNMLSVRDVARLLNISTATVYNYIKSGELPAYRFGKRKISINENEFKNWLSDHKLNAEG